MPNDSPSVLIWGAQYFRFGKVRQKIHFTASVERRFYYFNTILPTGIPIDKHSSLESLSVGFLACSACCWGHEYHRNSWKSPDIDLLNGLLSSFHTHRIHGAAIYGNIYHQYTMLAVSIFTMHGSYGISKDVTPNQRIWSEPILDTSRSLSCRSDHHAHISVQPAGCVLQRWGMWHPLKTETAYFWDAQYTCIYKVSSMYIPYIKLYIICMHMSCIKIWYDMKWYDMIWYAPPICA